MRKFHYRRLMIVCVTLLAILTVAAPDLQYVAAQQAGNPDGVVQLTGKVTVTSRFVLADTTEPFMALIDLTAFIKRDREMKLPYPTQTVTGLEGDLAKGAPFTMQLPIEPRALLNNVSNGKSKGQGLAVFALDFDTNPIGDGFLGSYEWRGWPGGLDSLKFNPGTNEVYGGRLIVWSPDDSEMFPTGFGDDGKLFTADDPVGAIPKGWTVVDIDEKPFKQIRTKSVEMPIGEGEAAENDLSKLTYTQAFDALVKDLRVRYTFTDFKKIDWDAIVAEIRPQVVKAEQAKDLEAFNIAMIRFSAKFHDGHLAADPPRDYFDKQAGGGIGIVLAYTSDNAIIARNVLANLPAADAGIKKGAVILQWNSTPIAQAIDQFELLFTTASSPQGILLAKLQYLTRSPVGTKVSIRYQNPGESAKTVSLTSVAERDSLYASTTYPQENIAEAPVERFYLGQLIGFIRINTFFGDSILLTHAWESAVQEFKDIGVTGLIIDVRSNGGGSGGLAAYFAGSFYKDSFVLNESFQADKDGKCISAGKDTVEPAPVQWDKPVAVLIGPECASACEIFSAAMAHNPEHLIVGKYPTAGVEAGVNPWTLPGKISFQAPVIRKQFPNGDIFLEGKGVQPNVQVPLTVENLTSVNDVDLITAARALQAQMSKVPTPTVEPTSVATEVPTAEAATMAATP